MNVSHSYHVDITCKVLGKDVAGNGWVKNLPDESAFEIAIFIVWFLIY